MTGLGPALVENDVFETVFSGEIDKILVGGGVIGLELGSVYARLGSKVSVLEFADGIIPTMDKALGKELQKSLAKLGIEFYLNHKVTGAKATAKEVTVTAENKEGKDP